MSRPQDQIDHIMQFWCGWCGAKVGECCMAKCRWSGKFYPIVDFHFLRTQSAYRSNSDQDCK